MKAKDQAQDHCESFKRMQHFGEHGTMTRRRCEILAIGFEKLKRDGVLSLFRGRIFLVAVVVLKNRPRGACG
jgi:hypothetical protein